MKYYCGSTQLHIEMVYETKHNGARQLFHCQNCAAVFSETHGTPMEQINSPLSKMAGVLRVRTEGARSAHHCTGVRQA